MYKTSISVALKKPTLVWVIAKCMKLPGWQCCPASNPQLPKLTGAGPFFSLFPYSLWFPHILTSSLPLSLSLPSVPHLPSFGVSSPCTSFPFPVLRSQFPTFPHYSENLRVSFNYCDNSKSQGSNNGIIKFFSWSFFSLVKVKISLFYHALSLQCCLVLVFQRNYEVWKHLSSHKADQFNLWVGK